MFKYIYKGKETVNIPYVGTFEPGKVYEVEKEIQHPDFKLVKEGIKNEKSIKNQKK